MAARCTPELVAYVGYRYENTDDALPRIAADAGISLRTVHRLAAGEGWKRRSDRPPRDLPPATRLLEEARVLAEQTMALPTHGGGEHRPALDDTSLVAAPPPEPSPPLAPLAQEAPSPPALGAIGRLERLVERELAAEERARTQLGALARPPAEAERTARTLASLTQTLHVLARLRSGLAPASGPDDDDDTPRDIDAFRRGLARRIREFVRSRTGGSVGGGAQPADGDSVGP